MYGRSRLVSTEGLAAKLASSSLKIVESGLDMHEYELEHIPGSVFLPLQGGLVNLDFSLKEKIQIAQVLSDYGISSDDEIVVVAENPAVSAWLYWLFTWMGAKNVLILDGGRKKWNAESKPRTDFITAIKAEEFRFIADDTSIDGNLSRKEDVLQCLQDSSSTLLDVRTKQEFDGEWFAEGPPASNQRAGHIPGAIHIPFDSALNTDGTFKEVVDLEQVYGSIARNQNIICYCAAGFRSALTWFVLKELLGYPMVSNYAGSWMEWSRDDSVPFVGPKRDELAHRREIVNAEFQKSSDESARENIL